MEIEYSSEKKGKIFAYRFEQWEMSTISKCLKPEVKRLEKKIESVRNNPRNEGQVTFQEQIRELRHEIQSLQDIIKTFSED
jgi:DNA mismatch repair ATPase MutS